ncbi:MAG: efflux RND transporter periplasmic adaptor subunit [bacterium]|nr:efflux RND transporter periplasmic adaptor subunit [bacterium]
MKKYFKGKKGLVIGAIIIVLAIAGFAFTGDGNGKRETAVVAKGDLVRSVRVSGKVVSRQSANLAFTAGGTVSSVNKSVGDSVRAGEAIVELDKASVAANLLKAESDLVAARAELSALQGGSVGTTGSTGAAKVDNVQGETAQKIVTAYTAADDAVHNKVDQLFTNPSSQNPEIMPSFKGYELRMRINSSRIDVEDVFTRWSLLAATIGNNSAGAAEALALSKSYGATVVAFLNDVAIAVNTMETNSNLTQATIDKYRTDIASARSAVNSALTDLASQTDRVSGVFSDVSVQAARVAAAEANVAAYRAQLSDTTIRAPFAGIVSRQDAKVGETVSQNATLVSVISPDLKIEAFVPEVSIAGIRIGNEAEITLDAYGSTEKFFATVSHIDPAETVRDGVSNYKIELAFKESDIRVRPGMTANVSIETLRKPETVMVPSRAVLDRDGQKIVFMATESAQERIVVTGSTDSRGNVEVLSGLTEGETIFLNPAK